MLGLSGTFWRRTNEGFPEGPHGPQNCNKEKLTWKKLEISLPFHQQSHDSPFCAACETAIARAAKLYIHVIYPSYFQTTHRPYKFPISSFAFIKAAFRRFCTIDIFHGDVMMRQQQILAAHFESTQFHHHHHHQPKGGRIYAGYREYTIPVHEPLKQVWPSLVHTTS